MIRKIEMNQNKLKITEETLRNIIIINLRFTKINSNFINTCAIIVYSFFITRKIRIIQTCGQFRAF